MIESVHAYPLSWPLGHPRASSRAKPVFGKRRSSEGDWRAITVAGALAEVNHEIDLMGGTGTRRTISTNLELRRDGAPYSVVRVPSDPGVAVYFMRGTRPYVFACDAWVTPAYNLKAIAMHLSALRGQARWGVGTLEQSLRGFELPPVRRDHAQAWWVVLGLDSTATLEQVEERFRALALERHPDRGGSSEAMATLNAAVALARRERGRGR